MAAPGLEMLKTYDFTENDVVLGGHRLSGYGEDGGVEYEQASEIGDHVAGADGQVTFSRNNDKRVIATITVMETSRAYQVLAELLRAQQAQTEIEPLTYLHRDNINGDQVQSKYAVFLNRPNPSKERTAGEREFQVLLPYAADKMQLGTKNVL